MRICAIHSSSYSIFFFRFFILFVCFVLLISMIIDPVMASTPAAGKEQLPGMNFYSIHLEGDNVPPTLNPIDNQTILEDSGTISISITGISAGFGDIGQNIIISALSSNPSILPDPMITYTSPEASGWLSFSPALNMSGTVDVTVTVQDDGGTENNAQDTTTQIFQITISPVNDSPVLSSFTKFGTRGKSLSFTPQDFKNAYSDVEGAPLSAIKVLSLPTTGTLTLSGAALFENSVISASQLSSLAFKPVPGWYGSTDFTWTATDGQDYAMNAAKVTLTYPYSLLSTYLPVVLAPMSLRQPWITKFKETFEEIFPGYWQLSSYLYVDGHYVDVTDLVSWGKRNCHAASGSFGGWAVGGGSVGNGSSCGDSYPDNIETWMVYGPFDLSQVTDGVMSLKIWSDDEYGYDEMGWGVSLDNDMFYGRIFTGDSNGWVADAIDLKNVYSIGNVTGYSQVWIGVWFSSDSLDLEYEEGVAIDDLILSTCSSIGGCTGTPATADILQISDTFNARSSSRSFHKDGLLPVSALPSTAFRAAP